MSYENPSAPRAATRRAARGSANGTTRVVYELTGEARKPGTFSHPGTLNQKSLARGRLAKPVVSTGACTASRSPSLSGIVSRLPRPGDLRPGLFPSPPNKEPGLFFAPPSPRRAHSVVGWAELAKPNTSALDLGLGGGTCGHPRSHAGQHVGLRKLSPTYSARFPNFCDEIFCPA